jgi:hypothetical protein
MAIQYHTSPYSFRFQLPGLLTRQKALHAATLPFAMPAAGPGVAVISLKRVTRRCCEGGMFFSSKACGIPPCNTPTRIMDSSCVKYNPSWFRNQPSQFFFRASGSSYGNSSAGGDTYVMCRVGVFINAAKKCGRCVFADLPHQQMTASRMLIEERSDVVDETGYEDQGSSLRLFLDYDARWC